MRVLVVEDQPLIAFMLADELSKSGHEVVGPASTSHEAVRLARLHMPNIAFVDLDLETKAAGLVVTERLATELGINVIMCTAQPALARRDPRGAVGLISKPYSPHEAVSCLAILKAGIDGSGSPPSHLSYPSSFELLHRLP